MHSRCTQGGWIRLFRANGLIVERLHEVQPPEGAVSTYRDEAQTEWARQLADGADLGGAQAMELSEHAARNRAEWNVWAAEYVEAGRRHWADDTITWGITSVPEAEVRVLPGSRGATCSRPAAAPPTCPPGSRAEAPAPTGIDVSEEQLATARRFQQEFGLEFPLVHGSAEALPFADESFDLVVSEYGASIWADPYVWIPRRRASCAREGTSSCS